MKQISITIALALSCTIANAQNITGSHQVRVDDEVKKQQVEYAAVDSTRQGMVWDLGEIELPKWSLTATYTAEDSRKGIVIGTERNTRNYYNSKPEALLLTGFENNLLKVEYDQPELLLRQPLTYGDRHEGQFHGTSAYCEKVFSRTFGTYLVEVDGTGLMLLPSGDTLRHVSRVHTTKLTSARFFPEVQRERLLKTYVDSIKFPVDSIRAGVARDTLVIETNNYRWYAAGYRYPVLEVISTGYKGEKPWMTEAYYCAPEDQQQLFDPENEEARNLSASNDTGTVADSKNSGQDSTQPSAMSRYDISVSGQTVTVDYDLTEDATVKALVCNVMGMVFRQQSQTHGAGEHYRMQLDCTGLRRGQYVLYLNVNGQVTGTTVSL